MLTSAAFSFVFYGSINEKCKQYFRKLSIGDSATFESKIFQGLLLAIELLKLFYVIQYESFIVNYCE